MIPARGPQSSMILVFASTAIITSIAIIIASRASICDYCFHCFSAWSIGVIATIQSIAIYCEYCWQQHMLSCGCLGQWGAACKRRLLGALGSAPYWGGALCKLPD